MTGGSIGHNSGFIIPFNQDSLILLVLDLVMLVLTSDKNTIIENSNK